MIFPEQPGFNDYVYMGYNHYYQEDSDAGLKLAALFLQLCKAPSSLSATEWDFLNTLPIGTLMEEAKISRKEAVHILNQIDQLEADVSKMGRFEHLTDAFMMWIVGGSFVLAGVLLAVLSIPESIAGRISVPISIGVGILLCYIPFLTRKRALTYKRNCLRSAVINILGAGLMRRSVLTTDALIRELDRRDPREPLFKIVNKFLDTPNPEYSEYEDRCVVEQLLDGFSLTLKDLPLEDQTKYFQKKEKIK